MKAIVYTKYGSPDVLHLQEVEKPIPADDQVLVKVHAVSVNAKDWHMMRGKPAIARFLIGGYRKPKNSILGSDIAGRVEAVGKSVTEFRPGDEVFGTVAAGGFAEYADGRERNLVRKPARVSFEAAAAVPIAAVTALQAVRDYGHVQAGQKVLINGASGGVGTYAVQLAKYFGAEVTGVCRTRNLDMARNIGADHVIDYTKEDFTKNGQQFDVIIDVAANHSLSALKRTLAPHGVRVGTGFSNILRLMQSMLLGPLLSKFGDKKFVSFMASIKRDDLDLLRELLETGKIAPVLDKCYPLSKTADAMRYFGVQHARGKIIITMQPENV